MRIGVTLFFQNYGDWDRYDAKEFDHPSAISDAEVYEQELHLGDLIEPLGFDSLWTVEHHNTPYTMIPERTNGEGRGLSCCTASLYGMVPGKTCSLSGGSITSPKAPIAWGC
jgi:alkanesulfonate monooxygenase SsuD/methylene tetrahydromethanopterin reductase-like flavin-dependent oxidoreductase (luciferase family)